MLGWFRSREREVAATGRIQEATFVVARVELGLGTGVTVSGIRVARKEALSLVRRTWMELL